MSNNVFLSNTNSPQKSSSSSFDMYICGILVGVLAYIATCAFSSSSACVVIYELVDVNDD